MCIYIYIYFYLLFIHNNLAKFRMQVNCRAFHKEFISISTAAGQCASKFYVAQSILIAVSDAAKN